MLFPAYYGHVCEKKTLQGLQKKKMIFIDHINCVSTCVQLNNNNLLSCGLQGHFFLTFYISDFLVAYSKSKKDYDNISHTMRFHINCILLSKVQNILGIQGASLEMFPFNLQLCI